MDSVNQSGNSASMCTTNNGCIRALRAKRSAIVLFVNTFGFNLYSFLVLIPIMVTLNKQGEHSTGVNLFPRG